MGVVIFVGDALVYLERREAAKRRMTMEDMKHRWMEIVDGKEREAHETLRRNLNL